MMSHKALAGFAAILCALSALTAGCQPRPVPPAMGHNPMPEGAYPKNIAIQGLHTALEARHAIVVAGDEQRPLEVTVPVLSFVEYGLNVQYKFEFFDRNARPLRVDEGYRFKHIEPGAEAFLRGNALDTAAVDWRLTVRPAR